MYRDDFFRGFIRKNDVKFEQKIKTSKEKKIDYVLIRIFIQIKCMDILYV